MNFYPLIKLKKIGSVRNYGSCGECSLALYKLCIKFD